MPEITENHAATGDTLHSSPSGTSSTNRRNMTATTILLLVNLLNYMDRYTIVGVMDHLKREFDMNDAEAGMLQTAFIGFFLVFAPMFGYFGDRYNRKILMIGGISVWIVAVFLSSFCGEGHYLLFLLCRGVVGIGEASYSTIAPTVLSDLFVGPARSKVFMMFYFAIPVGSGLGFITGSRIALWTDSWQWGVRFSPIIGIICIFLMTFLLEEPVRGECEGVRHTQSDQSIWQDVKYLCSVKTYCFATVASVALYFSVGTMSWWTPSYIGYAYAKINHLDKPEESVTANIALVFGLITCLAGLFGVATGSLMARAWTDGRGLFRNCASVKADTYISSISMFVGLPFLFSAVVVADYTIEWSFVLVYFAIMAMCLNWAVNVDILMYVIVVNRRATAIALQTLVAHLLGDATSPYIIGAIADKLRGGKTDAVSYFYAFRDALLIPGFMLVIAGAAYLASTFYVELDKKAANLLQDSESTDSIFGQDEGNYLVQNEEVQESDGLETNRNPNPA